MGPNSLMVVYVDPLGNLLQGTVTHMPPEVMQMENRRPQGMT